MSSKVFVGNLPWSVTTQDLTTIVGDIDLGFPCLSVQVVLDRTTGKSRGFAFLEFNTEEDASSAIKVLAGYLLDGRVLFANHARPKGGAKSSVRMQSAPEFQPTPKKASQGGDYRRDERGDDSKSRKKDGHPHRFYHGDGDVIDWFNPRRD